MMPDNTEEQPEPRNKTIAASVTVSERRDVALVAAAREVSESEIIRDMTITEIQAEAARIRAASRPEAA